MKRYRIERDSIEITVPQVRELFEEIYIAGLGKSTDQCFQRVLLDDATICEVYLGYRFDKKVLLIGDEIRYNACSDYMEVFDKERLSPNSHLIEIV